MEISAVIITLNEEKNLPRALKSLDFVDEVVVVDAFSRDRTAEIAESFGAKVFRREWEGYASQRNFAMEKATHPWVLFLDADEEVSQELREEIISLDFSADGYLIRRESFFAGKPMHCCGWWPDWGIRLFRKEKARWEGELVHESLVFSGKTRRLRGKILHYPYQRPRQLFERMSKYAKLWALRERGRKNPSWLRVCLQPVGTFLSSYILKGGIFCGWRGFTVSFAQSYYSFLKYLLLKEEKWTLKK